MKSSCDLPPLFLERLRDILPVDRYDEVVQTFSRSPIHSVRVNTLKISKSELLPILRKDGILCSDVPGIEEGLVLKGIDSSTLGQMALVKDGRIYPQGLSSMLPVVVLDPRPGDRVLDMCAAPGGKTTQMAARMANAGEITALETVRGRYYKLKSVVGLCGAKNVSIHLMDARKFRSRGDLFDKILVDAPCSSEGRFHVEDPKSFAYWSLRKIKEMSRKQKGLLLAASRLLRPGGTLVYSTCTFAPEENEESIRWLLKKTGGALEVSPIEPGSILRYPAKREWRGRLFGEEIAACLRILPTREAEGFFIGKLKSRISG